jgi:hypothetical protein
MTLSHFIFYMVGFFTLIECVLGSLRQFEDRLNVHAFYEIFAFTLLLITVAWCVVGIVIGDHISQFSTVLTLELAFPLYKLYYNYEEKVLFYITRKLITMIIVLWLMGEAIFNYCYC